MAVTTERVASLADLDGWLTAHDDVDDVLFWSKELERRGAALLATRRHTPSRVAVERDYSGCPCSPPTSTLDFGGSSIMKRSRVGTLASTALMVAALGCSDDVGEEQVSFDVRPGVEIVTVTNAEPRIPLSLYDAEGNKLLTLITDALGQAHFAYLPFEHTTIDSAHGTIPLSDGWTLKKGDGYVIHNEAVDPPEVSAPFSVLGVEDLPDPALYERQPLGGVPFGMFAGEVDPNEGFQYIEVRDGVKLSVMVRFPDPVLWGDGPWPTVIEYSGYSPSRPDRPEPGSQVATLLGYASVGVNMRGTGCSGGVFDVFNPAQHADGYDIVETVARQPWVLHNQVGMVGLSYSGISQLFVGRTRPPSLAAITPLSVIADLWQQQYPGGIYNSGFTRQWLEQRDAQASAGGQQWTDRRIEGGDTVCAQHQDLRNQNIDFEHFFRQLEFFPNDAADRSPPLLVDRIEAPVYLTGAWQDEQTGAQFADMLDRFTGTEHKKFTLYNGRHVDGYSPLVVARWHEFLEFYVAERIPRLDDFIRNMAGEELSKEFGVNGLEFGLDRFTGFADDDYAGALAAYEAEPLVRVLFENGAAGPEPGAPLARFESSYEAWPPPGATGRSFYLGAAGSLTDTPPDSPGIDTYQHDPDAGSKTFFGPQGYELMVPLWDIDWSQFPAGRSVSYVSAPFGEDTVIAGPGWAELFVSSEVTDVNVQVTLTAVRPDDTEYLLQSGWLRLGHRKIDEAASDTLRVVRSFREEDFEPLVPGEVVSAKVSIPSFAHVFRVGSRLRVIISDPGRNHGTWEFDSPDYGGATPQHSVHRSPTAASRIFLPVTTGVQVEPGFPPCPSLRGQPCRDYVPTTNTSEAG